MSKNGRKGGNGGPSFARHLPKPCPWPGDDGGDPTKEESFGDSGDGERGGLSECSDIVSDGGDVGFRNDMISTLMGVVVVR